MPSVTRPVTIAAKAANGDMGEAKEAKEVETDHAPKADVEEGGRAGKPPVPTTLQISRKKIRRLQKQTDQRLRILHEPRRTYLEKRGTIHTTNDPSRILLTTIFEDVS